MANSVLQLDNKFETALVFEQDQHLPIVSMQLVFRNSGSLFDGKKAGLAKTVAKMMGEGSKSLGSTAFAELLESKAIHLSAHCGVETFVFELSCLKSEFDAAIEAFEMLLKEPNFSDEVLEKIKKRSIGALMQKENDFDYVAARGLKRLLFEGSSLALPDAGTPETLESITLDDVKAFYTEHIVRAKAIGVFGGDISQKSAKETLATLLDILPDGKTVEVPTIEVRSDETEQKLIKDTKQAYIYFGAPFHVQVDSPDYYKARVAMYILGTGGFGTRLMEEIRVKRGLAYSVYSRMAVSKSHHYFTGQLQTKVESGDEALKIVKAEIEKFVKKGVKQKELDAAKEFLLGSEPLRTETLSQRLSRTFMNFYKGLPLDNNAKELKQIEDLSLAELNSFITAHPEILNLSVFTVTK